MFNADRQSDASQIASLRTAWLAAVKASDVDGLLALATDDIVVVPVNGKCVVGRDALRAHLAQGFELFDFERRDVSNEIGIHDNWAIGFSEGDSTLRVIKSGAQIEIRSNTLAVFARQADDAWKVARVIGLAG